MAIQKPKSLGTRVAKGKHQLINTHAATRGMTTADWVSDAIDEKFARETFITSGMTDVINACSINPMQVRNDGDVSECWKLQGKQADSVEKTIGLTRNIEPAILALVKIFIR